ncbi:GTP-binding protein [Acuticoccus sp. I52.16.1]|uniref:CobW family GTP-binding protein n=1 Tax=Acuticoccus sp. I52.16.1 TaxID=2928472 RepID=UPI001FD1FE85|nr:GTP-binding protein [Acuticoccus sp. I52.16.1]UOM32742.1 GTP-binding protein [Acuticoccus sp. I52.16.1]
MAESPAARIPVTILTGFLGAGKTTLLRRILSDAKGVRYAVLINDFGALNIDAELVVERTADRVQLENGCVCCSIRDDMVGAVGELLGGESRPDRLIIEASGVSRPLAIADALEQDALADRVALDGTFCLVDADTFPDLDFASTELAIDQVTGSDIVILNKVDLVAPAALASVEETLRGAMPRLRVLHARHADVPVEVLFGPREATPVDAPRQHADHAHGAREHATHDHDHDHDHHDHGDEFATWQWQTDRPVDLKKFRRALNALPTGLLRAKGVLRTDGDGRRLVFHLVGKRREMGFEEHPAPAVSTLVAIGRHEAIDAAALGAIFEDCLASEAAA